jgi:site-specific recombinase XerD
MGYLYQRKDRDGVPRGSYWVKYYVNGRAIRESTGTEKEGEARRFLKDREGRVATGAPMLPRADRVMFEEIAQDLRDYYETTGKRSWNEVRARFDHLAAFFAGYRAAAIGAADITRYVKQRQGQREQPANGTLNRELSVLSKMMRLAYENGKLLRLPVIRKLKEAAPRAGFFEREAYEAVQRHLPEDLRVASAIAYTYGWRMLDEVLPLERRQVDLDAGTLRLDPGRTKNEDGRVVYLTPELRVILAAQVERVRIVERQLGRIIPYLFPHLRGRRRRGERRQDFRKEWTTACKMAGVPGMLRHDFRRTAVRNMVNAGVPERVAMKVTGHKTRSVFDRYHIVSPADLQDVARRLTGTISGTVQTPGVAARPASSDNLRTRP